MYKTDYMADLKFVEAQDYLSAIRWAKYSHRHYMNAGRHRFLMAAYEYKVDRDAMLKRARLLRPKGIKS